jgi:catechol 2,3-dioxygenase-like lactoylglutathione lyase family enzyme
MLVAVLALAGSPVQAQTLVPPLADAAGSKEPPPGADGPLFRRQTLVVADMERALTIYRDLLGFTVYSLTESRPTSYSYPVFAIPKKAKIRFATLNGRDGQVRVLGLTEVTGAKLPKKGTPHAASVVINVSNLDAIMARVKQLGLKDVAPVPLRTADGRPAREYAFLDYDGHLIVLFSYDGPPPAAKPAP